MEMLSIEQAGELKNAIENAKKDDTPYMAIDNDEMHVFGNPNKTEVKPADYTVRFAFPNTDEYRKKAEINGDKILQSTKDGRYFICEREYKNIYITPRKIGAAVSALAQIESFLYSIQENGQLKELSYEEMQDVMNVMNNELSDAVYDLVSSVFRIPYEEQDFMLPLNAVQNAVLIATNNPSVVNEADLFFG